MKPKEWLVQNGHLDKVGRGRLSVSHIALIKEAVANGAEIEGYGPVKATAPLVTKASAPKVEKPRNDPNRIADCPDPIRDERDFVAIVTDNGKRREIGKRTVCNNCGSSLPYCPCPEPKVWLDHDHEAVVTFRQTKGAG